MPYIGAGEFGCRVHEHSSSAFFQLLHVGAEMRVRDQQRFNFVAGFRYPHILQLTVRWKGSRDPFLQGIQVTR